MEPTTGFLSHLAPKRSQFPAKPPPTTLPQPLSLQNDIVFQFFQKTFASYYFRRSVVYRELSWISPSTPLPQHRRPKNDIVFVIFWKNFRSIIFADKGRCSRLSPLDPIQQHEGPKNDTDFQIFMSFFFYLFNRNMLTPKTTRVSKKSSYYITEACTPQKATSNFQFR